MTKRPLVVILVLAFATACFVLQPSHVEHVGRDDGHAVYASSKPPRTVAASSQPTTTRHRPTAPETPTARNGKPPVEEAPENQNSCIQWDLNATTAKLAGVSAVQWCPPSPGRCAEGVIRIRVAKWPQPRALSSNATLSASLLERFGPLFFRLRLAGPEVYLFNPAPNAEAKTYDVRLPASSVAPGTYRVGLELLYRDYYAADEKTNHWPPLLKAPMLPVDAAFETSYHRQQCTLPSSVDLDCAGEPAPAGDSEAPLCDGTGSHAGLWRAAPGSVATRVRVRKIQRSPIVFKWAIEREDADWRFHRDGCRSRRIDFRMLQRVLKGKRIVVGGDSQLRALYYGLVNVLNGNEWPCVRNLSSVASEPPVCIQNTKGSQRKTIEGVQVDYVDDLFLEKFTGERYQGYDVVIVGFAQHPASKEHWTVDRYRGGVFAKAKKVRALRDQGSTVLWYGAPQYPHTTNGYPVVVKDWRTDARMMLFNDVSFAMMRGMGVPVVDSYSVVTAMSHTSPDQAHFSNWVCAELVNVVVDALCGAKPEWCAAAETR